jgi:hypothetical protein
MDFTSCSLFERILNLVCFQIGHVALSRWPIPVRMDHDLWPFDLKFYGRLRSSRTPSVNDSFGDVGSRSKGPGEEGERAHRGDTGGEVPTARVSMERLLRWSWRSTAWRMRCGLVRRGRRRGRWP